MRTVPVVTSAALLSPSCAGAAGGGFDLAGTLAQTVGSLILVIGIILILHYLAGRLMKVPKGGAFRYIRVVETRHLAPKKSLVLVEVGGEYLLLSSSGEGVSFIKQVDMIEEIEVVDERAYGTIIPLQVRDKLKTFGGHLAPERRPTPQLNKSGGLA